MAEWDTAYVNDLPDSAFLYIAPGGSKDAAGKTVPRSLRKFPYRNRNGDVDLPHLRNAAARIPQADIPAGVKTRLAARVRSLLDETNSRSSGPVNAEIRRRAGRG